MRWLTPVAYVIALIAVVRFVAGMPGWFADDPPPPPVVTVTDSGTVWQDRIEPPSGPRPTPVAEMRTNAPVEIRLAGCYQPVSAPAVAAEHVELVEEADPVEAEGGGIEALLAVRSVPGRVWATRYTAERLVVSEEYRLPERGNRISVTADEGRPVVVGDRWWFLRDVELVGLFDQQARLGIKVPVSTSWSVLGTRAADGSWGLGVGVRPFVRWP